MMDERIEEELSILSDDATTRSRAVLDQETLRQPIHRLSPRAPLCVELGATLADAVRVMREERVGCVLVVDAGYLAGIITERDLLLRVEDADLSRPVRRYMTAEPETLRPGDPIAFALNLMSVGGFRHVPLVDEVGRPVGMVSVKDVVNFLVDLFPQEVLTVPPDPRQAELWQTRDGG